MKYIYIYLTGIVFGLLIWYTRYIYKRCYEKKNEIELKDDCIENRGVLPNAIPSTSQLPTPSINEVYNLTNRVRLIAFIFLIVLIVGAILNAKYNLWEKVKPIIINIISIIKPIASFLLGLCTTYLTERMTKILNKARKKWKKKDKQKKHKDKKRKKNK